MSRNRRFIHVNGVLQPDHQPVFPAETVGSLYGAGCFETFRSYSGKYLHLDQHLHRFNRGLAYLNVAETHWLEEEAVRFHLQELLTENDLSTSDCRIRIHGSLLGNSGYSLDKTSDISLVITTSPAGSRSDMYRVKLSPITAIPSTSRPSDLKLSNTLHYMSAWQDANRNEMDDSLILNTKGCIAETSIANIFWKKGNTVYTSSEDCDILPGIMRNTVCKILSSLSPIQVETGSFTYSHIKEADLVWVTNSVKEIQAVSFLNGDSFPVKDSFYDRLYNELHVYKENHLF